jgi:guanylate kinase
MAFTSKALPILVIIGPSAAGKSTAIRALYEKGLIKINPTWTTRPARPGELAEGLEHRFVTDAEFKRKDKTGYFVESRQMFNLPFWYGLPRLEKSEPGKPSLVMLRASLMNSFKSYYPLNIVYQIEDKLDRVAQRLEQRATEGEPMGTRLNDHEKEIKAGRLLANRIFINDELDKLVVELTKAIKEDFNA